MKPNVLLSHVESVRPVMVLKGLWQDVLDTYHPAIGLRNGFILSCFFESQENCLSVRQGLRP